MYTTHSISIPSKIKKSLTDRHHAFLIQSHEAKAVSQRLHLSCSVNQAIPLSQDTTSLACASISNEPNSSQHSDEPARLFNRPAPNLCLRQQLIVAKHSQKEPSELRLQRTQAETTPIQGRAHHQPGHSHRRGRLLRHLRQDDTRRAKMATTMNGIRFEVEKSLEKSTHGNNHLESLLAYLRNWERLRGFE